MDTQINVAVTIDPAIFAGILVTTNDSRAILYWASDTPWLSYKWYEEMRANPEKMEEFVFSFDEDHPTHSDGTINLDWSALVAGAKAMVLAEAAGRYRNQYTSPLSVFTGNQVADCGDFCDHFIQFCAFGRVIYG
jgi:hypothetical protein